MLHHSFLLSVRREFSVRARLLIALLALIQIIAPTWHICELSGQSCCPSPTPGQTDLHCALPNESREGEVLSEPEATLGSPIESHDDNCLAKLLLGMPWQSVSPAELPQLFAALSSSTFVVRQFVALGTSPQPPARAPPFFSA